MKNDDYVSKLEQLKQPQIIFIKCGIKNEIKKCNKVSMKS